MAEDCGNGEGLELPVGKAAVDRLIKENSHIFSDGHCKVCNAVLISESQKLAHYQSKKHGNKFRRYTSIQQGEEITPAKRMKTDVVVDDDDDNTDACEDTDKNKSCAVCNMTFSSPVVAQSHYIGKTHSKNLKLKGQGGATEAIPVAKKTPAQVSTPGAPKPLTPVDESDPDKFCKLCKATFNNPHMAEQHYAGKKHRKQETKSKIMTIYTSSGSSLPQSTPLKPVAPGSASTGNGFTCGTCNVVVNSIDQYQAHISGAKHKNNMLSMVTTSSERLSPSDRKFSRFSSSNNYLSSETSSSYTSYMPSTRPSSYYSSSSSGRFSSSGTSSFPSSQSLSSSGSSSFGRSSAGGLLPLPSYSSSSQPSSYYQKDSAGSEGYGYSYNQGY